MDGLVDELLAGARAEIARVEERGGAVEAVPYMKAALVESHRERIARIESGEQVLVGVNRFRETEPSPLTAGGRRDHGRRAGHRGAKRGRRSRPGASSATAPRSTPRWPSCGASPRATRTSWTRR